MGGSKAVAGYMKMYRWVSGVPRCSNLTTTPQKGGRGNWRLEYPLSSLRTRVTGQKTDKDVQDLNSIEISQTQASATRSLQEQRSRSPFPAHGETLQARPYARP